MSALVLLGCAGQKLPPEGTIIKALIDESGLDRKICQAPKIEDGAYIGYASLATDSHGYCDLDSADNETPPNSVQFEAVVLQMFFDDESISLCTDIFGSWDLFRFALERVYLPKGEQTKALNAITKRLKELQLKVPPQLNRSQVAIASVLGVVQHWIYSPSTPSSDLYGCTDRSRPGMPKTVSIVLYSAACEALALYRTMHFAVLPRGIRVQLVAAHELGHVIDFLNGDYSTDVTGEELRATIYGTYIAECRIRMLEKLYSSGAKKPFDERERTQRFCLISELYAMERWLADARIRWQNSLSPQLDLNIRNAFFGRRHAVPDGKVTSAEVGESCPRTHADNIDGFNAEGVGK